MLIFSLFFFSIFFKELLILLFFLLLLFLNSCLTCSHRKAIPLFRVWKSLQRFIRVEIPHEGSHWGKALPLHGVWKELQEIITALYPSAGKAHSSVPLK